MTEAFSYDDNRASLRHDRAQAHDDLPPANTKRWVIRRKAQVVAAVESGVISLDEACARYALSVEEFLSWQQAIGEHGLRGLRATRVQHYRTTRSQTRH